MRRRALVVGAVLVVVGGSFGLYTTFVDPDPFSDGPGECGLGTGGVWPVADTNQSVTAVVEADRAVRTALTSTGGGYGAELVSNASRYEYLPRENVDDWFDDRVRSHVAAVGLRGRSEGYEFDGSGRVYYFVMDPADPTYRRTVFVTEDGEVFVVQQGAC